MKINKLGKSLCFAALFAAALSASATAAEIAARVVRANVAGVDVIVYPMGVKDVVTLVGSMPAGDAFAARDGGNVAAATLTGMMLDKGTRKQDKFAIARQLDSVGAELAFQVDEQTLGIGGRALKKDLPRLIRILAEELRLPAFAPEEFAKAQKQLNASLRSQLEDTNFRAKEAFLLSVYPDGHPNRPTPLKDWLTAVEHATPADVQAFYKKYYGPAHLRLVFVGDVNAKAVEAEVARAFIGWSGGVDALRSAPASALSALSVQKIPLAQKTSVSVTLGQPMGLRYTDPDNLALRAATAILGSGFTGRLMGTVRDKEGLTYGIGASVNDDTFVDGTWSVKATFAPALLDKGIASTRREVERWWQGGVTAEELAARKASLIGAYQVGLATTRGMADAILNTLDRGKSLSWLDELPKDIDALTLEQVNGVIKKYLDPQKMVLVEAGTFEAAALKPAAQ